MSQAITVRDTIRYVNQSKLGELLGESDYDDQKDNPTNKTNISPPLVLSFSDYLNRSQCVDSRCQV